MLTRKSSDDYSEYSEVYSIPGPDFEI